MHKIDKEKEEEQLKFLLEFLSYTKNYCVSIIDIVGSTRTVMNLPVKKVSMYYSIFLNKMANIANSFGAIIVKNIGDSLLYYFPNTETGEEKYFRDVFECSLTMLNKRQELNSYLSMEELPEINYRISAEYGYVVIARLSTSSVNDMFGSTINICSKINSLAKPNTFIIGEQLYNRAKIFKEYKFIEVNNNIQDYHVYLVSRES